MKTVLKTLLVAALTLATLDAKSSGSSSRSFSSSSSRSFSSSSKPSSWSKSSKPSSWSSSSSTKSSSNSAKYSGGSLFSSSSKPGSVSPQTSTRVGSKVEVSRYQSAVKSGKAFTTRESAVADFKAKNANTFTNKFTSEPAKRPSYIPNVYRSNGQTHTVVYDRQYGGYGYWNGGGPGLGTWIMYDALSDAAMMNTLMSRQNYYVGPPVQSGALSTFMSVIMWGGLVIAVIVLSVFLFTKKYI